MSVALWTILYTSVIARVLIITFHPWLRGKRQHEESGEALGDLSKIVENLVRLTIASLSSGSSDIQIHVLCLWTSYCANFYPLQ